MKRAPKKTSPTAPAPLRDVRVGEVWKRKDPSGAFTMFEVISITDGPHGLTVHGKTPSGKPLKAGYWHMRKQATRFVFVHADRVRDEGKVANG